MEKSDKENKSVDSSEGGRSSSNKKLKINPHIKITPTAKTNDQDEAKTEETNKIIEEKLKDFEIEEQQRKAAESLVEQKQKIVNEVRKMAEMADNIYAGKVENAQDDAGKVKAMYELFKTISKSSHEDYIEFIKHSLNTEINERLMDILLTYENNESNTIHKLQILIRDLQDKTPKIHSEVEKFVEVQKEWRKEKELEFEKSIKTIKSQMAPANTETGESEMMTKYKELCEYVDTMKGEGIEKIIKERDDKIKELEETKYVKLVESKNNIIEKIQTLKREISKLRSELPQSRRDYVKHKNESKKLVKIIDSNNKKKKDFKEKITLLNTKLKDHRLKQKELQDLVESLKETLH